MSFQIGEIVGDYKVIGLLGKGGMGTVYSVQHLISDRVEAMKVLLPDLAASTELADRFIREIRLQASLSHPNIAVLHTALRANNQLLMIMEHLEGVSLNEIIRSTQIPLPHVLDIGIQICAALGYAHERGIVYRDVKPSNIMVAPTGRVKLMDFGIARPGTSDLTQAGAAIGSIYYMSPEQVRGTSIDSRSDLYSLGVTVFEMATGQRPFTGENSYAVMQAQVNQPSPSPAVFNQGLPFDFCLAIQKALEKDPARRFQTAADFSRELSAIRERSAQSAPPLADLTATVLPGAQPPITRSGSGSGAGSSKFGPTALINFDPAGLERVRAQIAAHVGPMAKVLVQRAAKRAATWRELYQILATEIPEGKEREKFLSEQR